MKLYRKDKECNCDKDQFPAMEAAGWSKTKPKSKEEIAADKAAKAAAAK